MSTYVEADADLPLVQNVLEAPIRDQFAQAREYLAAVFAPGDWVELRLIPGATSRWFQIGDDQATQAALAWAAKRNATPEKPDNVYVGANPRKGDRQKGDGNVTLARTVFADFDGGTTPDEALERINAAGLPPPSLVIASGGGTHTYWLLEEPIADLERFRAIQKALAGRLNSDGTIFNPERIMRLPGFDNVKANRPGRPRCRIVEANGYLHASGVFPPEAQRTIRPPLPALPSASGSMGDIARAFLERGEILPAGRRHTMFSVACDLAARGWSVADAEAAIMRRMQTVGLCPEDLDDCPRQIRRAFGQPREPGHQATRSAPPAPWKPFPDGLLPDAVRDYVVQTAEGMACDTAMVAVPMLAALAGAIGNTYTIMLKSDWIEPAILWTAVVSESGSLKTPALRKALQFTRQLEVDIEARNAAADQEHQLARVQHEADLAAWKLAAKKSRTTAGQPPLAPPPPPQLAYVVSDATVEAMVDLLVQNPRGLLLERDELAGWLTGFDRYSNAGGGRVSSEVGHWLSMHNAEPLRFNRKGSGRRYVPRASVSIAGGIQPDTLTQAIGQQHIVNGLLARFLLVSPPQRPKKFNTSAAGFAAVDSAARLFASLYAAAMQSGNPVALPLDSDAEAAWHAFYDRHAIRQHEQTGAIRSMLAKAEAAAARLALVHYVCRQATGGEAQGDTVDANSIAAGVALAEWFADEWCRVYHATVGGGPRDDHDGELVSWVAGHGGRVAVREIGQRQRRYRDAGHLERTITRLVRDGRLVSFNVQNDAGGPPAQWVRLPGEVTP